MNAKVLIDAIVRQTTVLIARISTAAGIRAPLAHVADQVFLDLSNELEAQGLTRKVVADMFGMAIRGYQKKVQRLQESATVRDRTLWEALLEYIRTNDHVHRVDVSLRFRSDDPEAIAAVLRDLVDSGLVFATGQGNNTVYRATSQEEVQRLLDVGSAESLLGMVWATVYHNANIEPAQIAQRLNVQERRVLEAVQALLLDGRVECTDPASYRGLSAKELIVPVGAEFGWEVAVFDHFQAMASAVAAKLRLGATRSALGDVVGGTTLHFEVTRGHPLEQEVLSLLATVRAQANDLWRRVLEHNQEHPISEEERARVCFYFGQNVVGATESEERT